MYSTYGITLGGLIVEETSNHQFENYLSDNIWQPLEMKNTHITIPPEQQQNVAVGYEYNRNVNIPQGWEWYHTIPASSINSTAEDMAHWLIAHLNHGRYGNKRLMSDQMMDEMLKHQFSMHPDMYGMAYGFFEEYYKNIRFLYHGGNMAGFNSLVILIPEMNAGFFYVSQHEGSSIRDHLKWTILQRFYDSGYIPPKPQPAFKDAERSKLYAGTYKYNCYCHTCERQPQTLTFTVTANPDGSIQLNGGRWIETEDRLFVRDDGQSKIAFKADASGAITHMSFGGDWTFEKK